MIKYYKGRTNLAATIFVPVVCGNNCPFCNTNIIYDGFVFNEKYLNNIIDSIRICNNNDAIQEFVITGGEPIIDLPILKQIIDATEKPVFINTSLPLVDNIDECIDYINNEYKIKGINISRHINTLHNVKTCGIDVINKIKKYIRINCIVKENMLGDKLLEYIQYYATPYRMINLRADYRTVTLDTLKNRDSISQWLLDNFKYEYSNNCLVCNSEFYSDEVSTVVCYHRGLEQSCVVTNNRIYINDVIIDIYGNIYKDWTMIDDNEFIYALTHNLIK